MSSNRKRNIKKGLQYPIHVREGSRNDLETAYEVMLKASNSHNGLSPISMQDLYCLWDYLAPAGRLSLFVAEVEDKTVCCYVCFMTAKTFQSVYWGWSREYVEWEVPAVFEWKLIQHAKEKGFEWFDFVQIDAECYRAI